MTKIFNIPNQTVIGDPCSPPTERSALFTVNSVNQGALLPRMTALEMQAIVDPAAGLIVYNTDLSQFCFYTGSVWSPISSGGAGDPAPALSGFTTSVNTAAPNDVVAACVITAATAGADANFVLQPKGTGGIVTKIPDGTGIGGAARGANAVDLQMVRGTAVDTGDYVASGLQSVIGGGAYNTASGDNSVVSGGYANLASGSGALVGGGSGNQARAQYVAVSGGNGNYANADYSFIGGGDTNSARGSYSSVLCGQYNWASGDYASIAHGRGNYATGLASSSGGLANSASGQCSSAPYGQNCTADADYSSASGVLATARGQRYAQSFASGAFSGWPGQAQTTRFVQRVITTNENPKNLSVDDAPGQSYDGLIRIPNSAVYAFEALIAANASASSDAAGFRVTGCIMRPTNGGAATLAGVPTITSLGATPGAAAWSAAAGVSDDGTSLVFAVTGAYGASVKWVACINTVESVG